MMVGARPVIARAPHVAVVGGRGIDDALGCQPLDDRAGESRRLVERRLDVHHDLKVVTHVANYARRPLLKSPVRHELAGTRFDDHRARTTR